MKESRRQRQAVFYHFILAFVLLLRAAAQEVSAESCQFVYQKEPPVTREELNCDPFAVILLCEVSGPEGSDIEIVWFRNQEQVCNDSLIEAVDCPESNYESNYTSTNGSRFCSQLIQVDNQVKTGNRYFCHLTVNGSLTHTVPSRTFEVEGSAEYLNFAHSCLLRGPRYVSTNRCAEAGRDSLHVEVTLCSELSPTAMSISQQTTPIHNPSPSPSQIISSPTPSSLVGPGDPSGSSGNTPVWLYVVVAVAAVFGMVMVILGIACLVLCYKKLHTVNFKSLNRKRQETEMVDIE